jgi:hypothetical protein
MVLFVSPVCVVLFSIIMAGFPIVVGRLLFMNNGQFSWIVLSLIYAAWFSLAGCFLFPSCHFYLCLGAV